MVRVKVHADGGACHGTPLVDGRCPKCGVVPDMQSIELWPDTPRRDLTDLVPPASRPPADAIEWAIAAATQSGCQKSRRGVAIFGGATGEVIANGTNHRPLGGLCSGTEMCKATCRFICVHAEVMAIRRALVVLARSESALTRDWHHLRGLDAVHVKIDQHQQKVAGDGPSCLSCAREVLDIGLAGFWLFEESEAAEAFGMPHAGVWRRYTAEEFFRLSLLTDKDLPR